MKAFVKNGRLISLEGDEGNPINEGTLCSKGAAAAELAKTQERLRTPLYRPPFESAWREVSWDFAFQRIAKTIFKIRDETFSRLNKRCDGVAFLGGAINTNEEGYLYRKLAALLGIVSVEHQARI
jgi:formate dehydrogenase major subunit